jgi:type VI secretion system protein ImpC
MKVELPFVVGVLADLSGQPLVSLPSLRERKAVYIDRDDFNDVLAKAGPRLALRVPNRLGDTGAELAVELTFARIDDFEPTRVAEQIAPLNELLETRRDFVLALACIEGNDRLEQILNEALVDAEKARALARQLDVAPTPEPCQPLDPVVRVGSEAPSLFDRIISTMRSGLSDHFERTRKWCRCFLDHVARGLASGGDVEANLKRWIAAIDQRLSAQLNEVMHAPAFQRLEATWRGLAYLVHQSETSARLKIRVLNVSKAELCKNRGAAEYCDQSAFFSIIYEKEHCSLGGKPYGLLVADYYFDHQEDDVRLLHHLAEIAAYAHAPLIAAAKPSMFKVDDYSRLAELAGPSQWPDIFAGADYDRWNVFRESEAARWVALTLPRILARLPYGMNGQRVAEFNFEELEDGLNQRGFSWMSAAWALAARITDANARYATGTRMRGLVGKVEGVALHAFPDTDPPAPRPTEVAFAERRSMELSKLGFLPLSFTPYAGAAFLEMSLCQSPRDGSDAIELHNLLGATRFVHYLRMMCRDKIGAPVGSTCDGADERWLNDWLQNFVHAGPPPISPDVTVRRPLAAARVQIRPVAGKPGWHELVVDVQLHDLPRLRLIAEIPKRC